MVALSTKEELRALAEQAGRDLEGASAVEILRWADEQFGGSWAVASSMADAVVPSLAAQVRPGVSVLFLDTGYHFAETIGTRDAVASTYDVNVHTLLPLMTVEEQDEAFGAKLHDRDPDLCCAMRKVEPLDRGLSPYLAWASGLRRDQSSTRRHTKVVDWDGQRGKVKVNPLATWSQEQVEEYATEHSLLVNPLMSDGFPSIGCAPCTRRVDPGEELRAGRWSGTGKLECGIHG